MLNDDQRVASIEEVPLDPNRTRVDVLAWKAQTDWVYYNSKGQEIARSPARTYNQVEFWKLHPIRWSVGRYIVKENPTSSPPKDAAMVGEKDAWTNLENHEYSPLEDDHEPFVQDERRVPYSWYNPDEERIARKALEAAKKNKYHGDKEQAVLKLSKVLLESPTFKERRTAAIELGHIGWPAFVVLMETMFDDAHVHGAARNMINYGLGVSEALEEMIKRKNYEAYNAITEFYYTEFNGHPSGTYYYAQDEHHNWVKRRRDNAMLHSEIKQLDKASLANGGIDLNQINVLRNGKTVNVQFDPAQLNHWSKGALKALRRSSST